MNEVNPNVSESEPECERSEQKSRNKSYLCSPFEIAPKCLELRKIALQRDEETICKTMFW